MKVARPFSEVSTVSSYRTRRSFLTKGVLDYLLGKDHLHNLIVDHVENATKLSRKEQLEAYDGCARLRPVWDDIASRYDAVITPSVPDEAPMGLENTGDAVSTLFFLAVCSSLGVAHDTH